MAYVDLNNKLDWAMSFQRTGKFPLDRSSMFSSYADALKYAKQDGTDEREIGGTSYVGQIIVVYGPGVDGEAEEVSAYLITSVGVGATLVKLAATTASGNIEQDLIALQAKVGKLESKISDLEEKDSPSRTEFTGLEGKVTTNTSNITSVTGRVGKLETQIAGLSGGVKFVGTSTTDPSAGKVTIEGNPDYAPKAGDLVLYKKKEYIYDGSKWSEFGDEGSHITQEQADARYVQKTAYDLKVKALDQKDAEIEGKVTALETAGYITETNADTKYVAKEKGKSLVADTLITEITALPKFNSIESATLEIASETKELRIKAVPQNKVTGLIDALAGKADSGELTTLEGKVTAIEGKQAGWDAKYDLPVGGIPEKDLSEAVKNNLNHTNRDILDATSASFTTELKNKLDGIEAGANNYTLPQATATALGGVKVGTKSAEEGYDDEVKIDSVTGKLYSKKTKIATAVAPGDQNAVSSAAVNTAISGVDVKVQQNTQNITELDGVIGSWLDDENVPITQTVTQRFKTVENTLSACIRFEEII